MSFAEGRVDDVDSRDAETSADANTDSSRSETYELSITNAKINKGTKRK